jgi:hypothetical protein
VEVLICLDSFGSFLIKKKRTLIELNSFPLFFCSSKRKVPKEKDATREGIFLPHKLTRMCKPAATLFITLALLYLMPTLL